MTGDNRQHAQDTSANNTSEDLENMAKDNQNNKVENLGEWLNAPLGDAQENTEKDQAQPNQADRETGHDAYSDADPLKEMATRISKLEAEKNELIDRLMRANAEMENLRRRTEREVRDAGQYGVAKFARDILAIGDNLSRALEALPEDVRKGESEDETLKALAEGVAMTDRELHNVLERFGIKPIMPEGERFNPNMHQAMFEVEDPGVPSGTVMQVAQKGYSIGERVLRPALVGVSKGGPKPQRQQQAAQVENPPQSEEKVNPDAQEHSAEQTHTQAEQSGTRLDREA
jgi:molecular chaperone GrpE